MVAVNINLNSLAHAAGTAQVAVWTKQYWNDPWVRSNNVIVQEAVWRVAPGISTATLEYRFGLVASPGQQAATVRAQLDNTRYYVLIQYTGDDGDSQYWLGYSEAPVVTQRSPNGAGDVPTGIQIVPCYGIDRMLQYAWINHAVIKNPKDDAPADEKILPKQSMPIFNRDQKGNKTTVEIGIDVEIEVFETRSFDNIPQQWSSRDILKYLGRFCLPTNDYNQSVFPWAVANDLSMVPDWENPTIDCNKKTCWDVLNELLPDDKMLGWYVNPVIVNRMNFFGELPPIVSRIEITPFSRLPSSVSLPDSRTMPAANRVVTWNSENDPVTDGEVQFDDSDTVDQVIVQGPREIGIGTFMVNRELERAWSDTFTEMYNKAMSEDPGWAALKPWEKAEWNDAFRKRSFLTNVFRLYAIKNDWDGKCYRVQDDSRNPVFQEVPPETESEEPTTYLPYISECELIDDLPIYNGIDYSGDVGTVDESNGRTRQPILAFIRPPVGPFKLVVVQSFWTVTGNQPFRNPNSLPFEVEIKAENEDIPAIAVRSTGAPRHAWDKDFEPNDGDVEKANPKVWGEFNIEQLRVTAAIRGDRRPSWKIPATVNKEFAKRRIIQLDHKSLQHIHIAKGTIVAVDHLGQIKESNGGVLRDPLPVIQSLAMIAAKGLIEPRKSLSIRTGRVVGGVRIGDLIASYNSQSVNTIISEIRIGTPTAEGDSPPPLVMTVTAATNVVDIVALIGRVPEVKETSLK